MKTGTCSEERLMHFQCGTCEKWWSIADVRKQNFWFCPWCGTKQKFEQNGNVAKKS